MATQPVTQATALVPQVSDEQVQAIEKGRNRLLERALELVINSPETETIGWGLINGIADLKKQITQDFKDSKEASYRAWKAICAQENGHLEKLVEPDKIVRGKLADWDQEKRRIQAEADRQAREAAEAERRRLQAIADEQARQEQERRRKEAEEQRLKEAIAAEQAGKADVAAAILEQPVVITPVVAIPVVVAPVVVPNAAVRVEGAGAMVDDWRFRITNEALIPNMFRVVDEKAIQKVVTALKSKTNIPGIEVYNQPKPRTSGRR